MKNTFFKRLSAIFATAAIAASCSTVMASAQAGTASMTLTDATAIGGNLVTVDLMVNTNNLCAGYNIDIEFDDDLVLKNVEGVMTTCTVENVVSLVNFTGTYFKDDKVLSTLTFEVPADASEGEEYDVRVKGITNFCTDTEEFENVVINNSTIEILESGDKGVTDHMVYVEEGATTSTVVGMRGDVNNDGKVDLYDALAVAKQMMSIEELDAKQSFFGNVNEDGKIDLYDVINICKYGLAADKSWGSIINI